MNEADRAALAHLVIGPDRAQQLIQRYADRLSRRFGMRPTAARRYAAAVYEQADPLLMLAVGQTWSSSLPSGQQRHYTVRGLQGEMVDVGGGRYLHYRQFGRMWLTGWPAQYTPRACAPQPSSQPRCAPADQRDPFDPRALCITVSRLDETHGQMSAGLPLLGAHYRALDCGQHDAPAYQNQLHLPNYLDAHLVDYRAGWQRCADRFTDTEPLRYFTQLTGKPAGGLAVAAYLGWWLRQRINADVVDEYGGSAADFVVRFRWSASRAAAVIEAAPSADPRQPIPPDHPLAQCRGQLRLDDLDQHGDDQHSDMRHNKVRA